MSKKTPEQQQQRNEAIVSGVKKAYLFTSGVVKSYYRWAGNLPKGKGVRTIARVMPFVLVVGILPNGGSETNSQQIARQEPSAVVKNDKTENLSSPPAPKTERQKFADTLTSSTPGILAQEQVSILAPSWYDTRAELWRGIEGASIDNAEATVAQVLKDLAYTRGFSWDDKMIENMSVGIVKGLYKWNSN